MATRVFGRLAVAGGRSVERGLGGSTRGGGGVVAGVWRGGGGGGGGNFECYVRSQPYSCGSTLRHGTAYSLSAALRSATSSSSSSSSSSVMDANRRRGTVSNGGGGGMNALTAAAGVRTRMFSASTAVHNADKKKADSDDATSISTNTNTSTAADSASAGDGDLDNGGNAAAASDRFRAFVKQYGPVGFGTHIALALCSLGCFYTAARVGLDVSALFRVIGVESNVAAEAGTFAVAYAAHKMTAPLRISLTIIVTPVLVRQLRRIGFFKGRSFDAPEMARTDSGRDNASGSGGAAGGSGGGGSDSSRTPKQ